MRKALWSEKGHTHSDFTRHGHYLVRLSMVGWQGRQGEGDNGVCGAVSDFHDSNPQRCHRRLARENNVEKALEALKEIQSEHATVISDGSKVSKLPAKELVLGDIVELKVGDKSAG